MLYTKNGDNGRSATKTRLNIPKNSPIFELMGTLDECVSFLGLAKQHAPSTQVVDLLEMIQKGAMAICAELAGGEKYASAARVAELEKAIDTISTALPQPFTFALPGKTPCGAALDVARTVARRAERNAVAMSTMGGVPRDMLAWLNRVSDLLFALARLCEQQGNDKPAAPAPTTSSPAPAYAKVSGITCRQATALCEAVLQKARDNGLRLVTAVCDAGGNLVTFLRDDDALVGSIDIAINKAFTAASLKMSTEEVGRLAQPGASLYGIQHTNNGKIVIFGGGVPLLYDGVVVGALGVSGGTLEQDTAIGQYGAQIAPQYLNKEV